jgi:hypothetical protein
VLSASTSAVRLPSRIFTLVGRYLTWVCHAFVSGSTFPFRNRIKFGNRDVPSCSSSLSPASNGRRTMHRRVRVGLHNPFFCI